MIIKLAEGKGGGKKNGSYGALAKYLTNEPEKGERVQDYWLTNLVSPDVESAVLEIENTQRKNVKVKKSPNYHLVVSFANGETISVETMKEMEKQIVKALGFEEHQRISVVHKDSDNLHWHIAINRIHPKTLKSHEPWRGKMIMQEISAKLEEEYDLVRVNHTSTQTISQSKAKDLEAHRGQESMITYAKSFADKLQKAESWQEFHKVLGDNGLKIKQQGQGYVIGNDETFIKASSIARDLSKKYLEGKFGEFQEFIVPDVDKNKLNRDEKNQHRRYEAKPIEPEFYFDRDRAEERFWQDAEKEYKKIYSSGFISQKRRAELRQEWQEQKEKKESWKDYCHRKANAGSREHLYILRGLERHAKLKGNILSGHKFRELPWQWDRVTKGGVIKYKSNFGIVRDEGRSISVEKINMQSVAFLVDVSIYKFALSEGKTIKISDKADKKFKRMVVNYAKANGIENKIRDFDKLEKQYGRDSVVSVYKQKIIKKLGINLDQFRAEIPKSAFKKEQIQRQPKKKKQNEQGLHR